jgi:hypothetical protein
LGREWAAPAAPTAPTAAAVVAPAALSAPAAAAAAAAGRRARLVRPALSPWVLNHTRVTMETHPWPTGGPEACAQVMAMLAALGVPRAALTVTEDVTALFGKYTAGMAVWEGGAHARGDVLVTTEFAPCPLAPAAGARQLAYELSDLRGATEQPDQVACAWLGHSHYTRDVQRAAPRALVRLYASDTFAAGAPASMREAAAGKSATPLVVIDGDFPHAPALRAGLAAGRHAGAHEVVELRGFTPADVRALFARATVIVDGDMPGTERAVQEAALFFAVPVLERAGRAGADAVDFPVPRALTFDGDAAMVAAVERVLDNWTAAALETGPARAWFARQQGVGLTDAARLFESSGLAVHVLACGTSGGLPGAAAALRAALLVAAAATLAAPLSAVTVHVGGDAAGAAACAALPACARTREAASGGVLKGFPHVAVVGASPLCAAGAAVAAAVAATALDRFGPPEHRALLSWRALPLEAPALAAWQAAARGGACGGAPAPLFVGVARAHLGALLDGGGSDGGAARAELDAAGAWALAPAPPHAGCALEARAGGAAGPAFLDLAPILGGAHVPLDAGCELVGDEAAQDLAEALAEAGEPLPADVAQLRFSCLGGGEPRAVTALVCSNARFAALARDVGLWEALCDERGAAAAVVDGGAGGGRVQ